MSLFDVQRGSFKRPPSTRLNVERQSGADSTPIDRLPGLLFALLWLAAVLLATLSPAKEWNDARRHLLCVLCWDSSPLDVLGNIALYVPFGATLPLIGWSIPSTVLGAFMTTSLVETAQIWIPGRDPSVIDVLCNVAGTVLGCWATRGRLGRAYPDLVQQLNRLLLRPVPTIANRLAIAAASFACVAFVATAALLTPSTPSGPYVVGASAFKATALPLRIGGNTDARDYFEGLLDEVRIYQRPKTAGEIAADMNVPLDAEGGNSEGLPAMVAAYSFDEGAGEFLSDSSGEGNDGTLVGPRWVPDGKFGGALRFDGRDDVVVVPDAESQRLSTGMTIEAWVRPTGRPRGWANVVQKDVDAYFLTASSDAGSLHPAAGGTFGGLLLNIQAPPSVPLNKWTHLATSYDGSTLRLYMNGKQVASRTLWTRSRHVELSIGDLALRPGPVASSDAVRDGLARGDVIRLSALVELRLDSDAPIVGLYDRHHREILSIGRAGNDLGFRYATRAASLGLNVPDLVVPEALRPSGTERALSVTVASQHGGYCVDVNGRAACGIGYALGDGWVLLMDSQALPRWISAGLSSLWLAALACPIGFWAPRTRAGWGSMLAVVLALMVLPRLLHVQTTPILQVAAAVGGLGLGHVCQRTLEAIES